MEPSIYPPLEKMVSSPPPNSAGSTDSGGAGGSASELTSPAHKMIKHQAPKQLFPRGKSPSPRNITRTKQRQEAERMIPAKMPKEMARKDSVKGSPRLALKFTPELTQMISNVYHHLERRGVENPVAETAAACDIHRASVYRVLERVKERETADAAKAADTGSSADDETTNSDQLPSTSTSGVRGRSLFRSRSLDLLRAKKRRRFRKKKSWADVDMDRVTAYVQDNVRDVINKQFRSGKFFSVADIHRQLQERLSDAEYCYSQRQLYSIMRQMGYVYTRPGNLNQTIWLRRDLHTRRRDYLRRIRQYREEGRRLFWLDETWVWERTTPHKVWANPGFLDNPHLAMQHGEQMTFKTPIGHGRRLIVAHAMSEQGLVEGAQLLFNTTGEKADYHGDMNSANFEKWFSRLLEKVPKGSVLIMDNATYHSRRAVNVPKPSTSSKQAIKDFIGEHEDEIGLTTEDWEFINARKRTTTKKALYERFVAPIASQYQEQVVDQMAKAAGCTVLRLPPYHCTLNPIELLWANVKRRVAKENSEHKIKSVQELTEKVFVEVGEDKEFFAKLVQHVEGVEEEFCRLDGVNRSEPPVQPLIIPNLSSDSDDDSAGDPDLGDSDSLSRGLDQVPVEAATIDTVTAPAEVGRRHVNNPAEAAPSLPPQPDGADRRWV